MHEQTMVKREAWDVLVVGGGLGGMATALGLARRGKRVKLVEAAPRLGGRGASDEVAGFVFNQGPHALYPASAWLLGQLGVRVEGRRVPSEGMMLDELERLVPIPGGVWSFLSSSWLDGRDRLSLARGMTAVLFAQTEGRDREAPELMLSEWLAGRALTSRAEAILRTLLGLATYGAAPEHSAAGPALAQLRAVVLGGVRYLDGGWQALVSAVHASLTAVKVEIALGTRATELHPASGGGWDVALQSSDGVGVHHAAHVVLAGSPGLASTLLGPLGLHEKPAGAPLAVACLELGLEAVPRGACLASFGSREPTYVSVHSQVARLAPQGLAMVHAALYLNDRAPTAAADRAAIERALERWSPGWKRLVLTERFTPRAVAAHARVEGGGLRARPSVLVAGAPGLTRVGDWVGREGMLLDAVLASAREAVRVTCDVRAQMRELPSSRRVSSAPTLPSTRGPRVEDDGPSSGQETRDSPVAAARSC